MRYTSFQVFRDFGNPLPLGRGGCQESSIMAAWAFIITGAIVFLFNPHRYFMRGGFFILFLAAASLSSTITGYLNWLQNTPNGTFDLFISTGSPTELWVTFLLIFIAIILFGLQSWHDKR